MSKKDIYSVIADKDKMSIVRSTGKKGIVPHILVDNDEYGPYLQVCDDKKKPILLSVGDVDRAYRPFVDRYNAAQSNLWNIIDWDDKPQLLYLETYGYLLDFLPNRAAIQLWDGSTMLYEKMYTAELKIVIKAQKNGYESKIVGLKGGEYSEDLDVLSDQYVRFGDQLVRSETVLNNVKLLSYIERTFPTEELNLFLSIICSYITSDYFELENYRNVYNNRPIKGQKALILDNIDDQGNLFLKVQETVENLKDIDSLEKYDLDHVAHVNEELKTVTITPYRRSSEQMLKDELLATLESNMGKRAMKQVGVVPPYLVFGNEAAKNFLTNVLPQLIDDYEIFGQEKLKAYKISYAKPTLNARLTSGLDYLEGEITLDFGDEIMDLFQAINLWKKNKYVKLANGDQAIVSEKYMKKLERLISKSDGGARISFFDLPLVEELLSEQLDSSVFEKHRAVYEGFNKLEKLTVPKKVKATLRDYQKSGVAWLNYLHKNNLNGCLADDMGLGKTLQTLTMLSMNKSDKCSIIIMPRTLLYNWAAEIEKFTPHISFYVYYGLDRDIAEAKKHQLILTTYGLVRNDIEHLLDEEFHYIILDESQNIKNIAAKATKSVMLLKGEHKLALSGTPLENNLGELYSLFRFLNPAMFGSEQSFTQRYIGPIQKNGDEEVTDELRRKIYPFIMRRLKNDVLKELPKKVDNVIYVEQSKEQRKVYEERRQFYKLAIDKMIDTEGLGKSQFFVFQALSELRQLAAIPESKTQGKVRSPKLDVMAEHMIQAIQNGHKVLVFANFVAAVDHVSTMLEDHGIHYVSMTGSTRNREELVREFKNNRDCKAFVMTLKTGGTGLNLTEADIVYIFDPWWNVAAETQAIDRAHRIGQSNTVMSYRLITKDTIEEKILQLQSQKQELFDALISSDTAVGKALSADDIKFILK